MNIRAISIILTTLVICLHLQAQKTTHMENKRFDVATFDKQKIDNEYNFEVGDTIVRQVEFSDSYVTYTTYKNNNYEDRCTYDKNTKTIKIEGRLFGDFPIGVFKYYAPSGILLEERNFDYSFDFSVEQLIEKMKREYDIDINVNDPQNIVVVREDSPYPTYKVVIRDKEYGFRFIIVNGKNGETIAEIDRDGNETEINPAPSAPITENKPKKNWFGF